MKLSLLQLQALAKIAVKYFPTCVIGGGAPRDAAADVDIKDIDLFIDIRLMDHPEYEKAVEGFRAALGGTVRPTSTPSVEAERSYDLDAPGFPVIQLLPVFRCVYRDIFDYDFGFSQIAVTEHGPLTSSAWLKDVWNDTITYMKKSPDPKSAARLQRLKAKYPKRTFVNCEELEG
ncbi:hypothetical protein [Achromobacter sp. NFACC18-2]|uniref:hypothetical protein n=1 Tax=Achromobacter sp. NFACC18-2 TaxID=1564112 RepID=UPI0008CA02DF|nr:hypothetical protein [Achromobacter sp. NFACC18-2]SEJ85019.1 hypothetical protein SAMN03159494_03570 [Achromobacter sp. NFACC18-2]